MQNARDLLKYTGAMCARLEEQMRGDPWSRLPPHERIDHLPELLTALLQDAIAPDGPAEQRAAILQFAREHGMQRGQRGFNEEAIFEEYYLLRREACAVMRSLYSDLDLEDVICRLDAAISIATVASLRGLHGRGTEGL